jgi:hypothetical protein
MWDLCVGDWRSTIGVAVRDFGEPVGLQGEMWKLNDWVGVKKKKMYCYFFWVGVLFNRAVLMNLIFGFSEAI